jgi:hypothetical protein
LIADIEKILKVPVQNVPSSVNAARFIPTSSGGISQKISDLNPKKFQKNPNRGFLKLVCDYAEVS